MKRFYLLFLLVLLPLIANADPVEINGIYYNLVSKVKTAEVTSNPNKYSGKVAIPKTVTYGGKEYSVTSIGKEAFDCCYGLTSITIPNSVTSIGDWAFSLCSGLTSITIPNSVTSITDYAFNRCSGLTSITIPNSVTSIGNYAFDGCSGLTTLTIPNSVTSIGSAAFRGCSSLTSIIIPKSVTSISGYTFSGCSGLTSIIVKEGNTVYDSRDNCNAIIETASNTLITGCQNTAIPASVTLIGESAFSGCSGLTSITIPNSVTSIGNYSFSSCSGLTSVTIPNSVTSIETTAFKGCSGLTSIIVEEGNTAYDSRDNCNAIIKTKTNSLILGCKNTIIPNSVTSIGNGAFYKCSSLTSITIPNSVTSIGWNSFEGSGLTSITIPPSVTDIGVWAFHGCSSLISAIIGDGVKIIYDGAFGSCSSLKTLIIGKNIEDFGHSALIFCNALSDIYCFAENVPSNDRSLGGGINATLHVPAGSVNAYKATAPWSSFKNIVAISSNVKLNKSKATVEKGKTITLKATVTPADLSDKSVTWKSSNTKVATVTSTGKVKGVKAGTATITCTSVATGLSATCKVTVGYVTLDKSEAVIKKGKTLTLSPTVYPSSLTDKSVAWKSSDESIATVTSEGKVKGVKYGTATITCTSNATGLSITCKVTVGLVKLDKTNATIEKGTTLTLKPTVYPSSLEDKSVKWTSSDKTVATVSSSGKVKGIKAGTATITCTSVATGLSATCKVTVINGTVTLNKTETFIEKGKTTTLKATLTPTTLEDMSVTWTSSDKTVATVSSSGKVKGVGYGTATITCTSVATGISATCQVTIGKVVLNTPEFTLRKTRTLTLVATLYPTTLTDKSVTWKSSDTKVATVSSSGKVKGVGAGTATITCTSNATGLKGTCTVTVLAVSESRSIEGDDDEATGIDEINVEPTEVQPYDVYDLSGRKVAHQVTTLEGLPNGIYIVNGKKMLKK